MEEKIAKVECIGDGFGDCDRAGRGQDQRWSGGERRTVVTELGASDLEALMGPLV